MQFLRRQFRSSVLWAMIPLALIGTQPALGCQCADGHVEHFCSAHHDSADSGPSHPGCCGCCGHCSEGAHSCCMARQRPETQHPTNNTSSQSCVTTPACHCIPIANSAITAPDSKAVTYNVLDAAWLPAYTDSVVRVAAAWEPALDPPNTGPPLDLVVTLRRLVI